MDFKQTDMLDLKEIPDFGNHYLLNLRSMNSTIIDSISLTGTVFTLRERGYCEETLSHGQTCPNSLEVGEWYCYSRK